jgi:hypothetical protein
VTLAVPAIQAPTREAQPPPSIEERPVNDLPDAALIAACEGLVYRALERAGNRLRAAVTRPPNVPSYETHLFVKAKGKVLEDAWSCAPQVLDGIANSDRVIPVLDAYCQSLIAEQSPHKRERLVNWLRAVEQQVSA